MAKNVLGGDLMPCSIEPLTGWFRDASCNTSPEDMGSHTVCCEMTAEFLEFSKAAGNDLSTPMPEYRFPGLRPGDRWCLGAYRWQEAYEAGAAPKVILVSTHERALEVCDLEALREHGLLGPSPGAVDTEGFEGAVVVGRTMGAMVPEAMSRVSGQKTLSDEIVPIHMERTEV